MLTALQARGILSDLGWDTVPFGRALTLFQVGYVGPGQPIRLRPSGALDATTAEALAIADARRRAGRSTASRYFSFSEVTCRCNGRFAECRRTWVTRDLLVAADRLREACYPRGLVPASVCRCAGQNARTPGAATTSLHLQGKAMDVPPVLLPDLVRGMGLFSEIGTRRGKVCHVAIGGDPHRPEVFPED